jgi:mRNA interferase RelE/StbE
VSDETAGNTPWSIDFTKRADKDMERLDQPVRQRVADALDRLAKDPQSASLRKLAGRSGSRLRVGDWRVLLELDNKTQAIHVKRVLPRGRAYDR